MFVDLITSVRLKPVLTGRSIHTSVSPKKQTETKTTETTSET